MYRVQTQIISEATKCQVLQYSMRDTHNTPSQIFRNTMKISDKPEIKHAEIMSQKYSNIPIKQYVKHSTCSGNDHHSLHKMAEALI